jgi:hypothetical protein
LTRDHDQALASTPDAISHIDSTDNAMTKSLDESGNQFA